MDIWETTLTKHGNLGSDDAIFEVTLGDLRVEVDSRPRSAFQRQSKNQTRHNKYTEVIYIHISDIFVVKYSETYFGELHPKTNVKDWEHLNSNGAQLKASQLQPVLTLAEAVMQSVAVWYNVSGSKQCWDIPEVWFVLVFQIYLLPKSESVESVQLWEWHMFWRWFHNFRWFHYKK